jgi:hypothetical protein
MDLGKDGQHSGDQARKRSNPSHDIRKQGWGCSDHQGDEWRDFVDDLLERQLLGTLAYGEDAHETQGTTEGPVSSRWNPGFGKQQTGVVRLVRVHHRLVCDVVQVSGSAARQRAYDAMCWWLCQEDRNQKSEVRPLIGQMAETGVGGMDRRGESWA